MTSEEAYEIRSHLAKSLEEYGFGDINREVMSILREMISSDNNHKPSERSLLFFYLRESISALKSISNDHYDDILNKLNRYIETKDKAIGTISVMLIDEENNISEESNEFDLAYLPSYQEIIEVLVEVQNIIESDF